ncbi:MAG: hypothetical protein ABFC24_12715 [Methanoregulaceae archaeon]
MSPANQIPYQELSGIANRLFEESCDDEELLATALDRVPGDVRSQLLVSDLLNAYQVFYYFFRKRPDEEITERLMLESGSALVSGVFVDEVDLLELKFRVENASPVIDISDGQEVLSAFRGKTAFDDAMRYLERTF